LRYFTIKIPIREAKEIPINIQGKFCFNPAEIEAKEINFPFATFGCQTSTIVQWLGKKQVG
jgi:hypothetical protein